MTGEPSDIVETGYDRIADRHLAWIGQIQGDPRLRFLNELLALLPPHPSMLDLGCGAGIPCTALLAQHGEVTGVDISARQIELARRKVPQARFIEADMTAVELPAGSFDAVTAFYSIAHVPRARHGTMFQRIATWLRPGGYLLAALGCGDTDVTVPDWLGAPMFFSSHAPPANRRLLARAGLAVFTDKLVTLHEPEGPATFQWVIATRPSEHTTGPATPGP